MAFEYPSLNNLEYSIPDSEKRALNLPITIVKPDGTTVSEIVEEKGNEALAYSAMFDKIDSAIGLLVAYSALLERIDDKRFKKAKQIKNELLAGRLPLVLHNIMGSYDMPADRKLEFAEVLFSLSSRYIISALAEDSKYQSTIVGPLRDAAKHLIDITNEIRLDRELMKDREDMMRRSSQKKSIQLFQAMAKHHNVMCNFCVRTSHDESPFIAISKIQHEKDCIFRQDHDLQFKQLMEQEILDHYNIKKPLTPTKEQTNEDEVLDSIETGQLGQSDDKPKKSSKKRGRKNEY